MSTIPVKFLHTQLPTLSNTTNVLGSFIEKFDAFLSDGFNEQTFSSGEIKDNILTITHPENQGYGFNTVVAISDNSTLEGEYRVVGISKTTTSIKVDKSDQTVTSFKVKAAPLGWTKHVFNTNERVYTPVGSHFDHSLYVKDAFNDQMEVSIVRYTSGNIEKIFPKSTYNPELTGSTPSISAYTVNTGYFLKTNTASSQTNVQRSFTIIGDSKSFYYCPSQNNSNTPVSLERQLNTGGVYFYGEVKGLDPDEYYTALFCDLRKANYVNLDIGYLANPNNNSNSDITYHALYGLVNNQGYKDRIQFGFTGSDAIIFGSNNSNIIGNNPNFFGSNSNKIVVGSFYVLNFNTRTIIAQLPGMYSFGITSDYQRFNDYTFQFYKGRGKLQNKLLLLKANHVYYSGYNVSNRVLKIFDLDGPWDS